MQPDPLGLAGSYNNLYSYAFQNPVNLSDPSGLSIEDDANSLQENLLQGLGPEEDALADLGSDLVHEAEAFPGQVADAEAGLEQVTQVEHTTQAGKDGPVCAPTQRSTSVNQLDRQVQRGQAPRGVRTVHSGNLDIVGDQDHIHFNDGAALNRDGSWRHGRTNITNKQKTWIQKNGWNVPE